MNKPSNGFGSNSYDDLLDEYAGMTASKNAKKDGSVKPPQKKETKPVKGTAEKKKTAPASTSSARPKYNIDVSNKKAPQKPSTVNIDFIEPFKDSDTMEFSKQVNTKKAEPVIAKRNIGNRGSGKLNAVKKKIYTDKTSPDSTAKSKSKGSKKSFGAGIVAIVKSRKKAFIVFCCCILATVIISGFALSCINDILGIGRNGDKVIEVVLPNDSDTADAVKVLDKAGLIHNRLFCNIFLKFMKVRDDNYLPGVYYFTKDMGVEKMIARFKTSSQRGAVISITIPEGYTIDQIFQRLEKNEICSASSLYKTVDDIDFSSEYDFIAQIQDKSNRYHALEGYFYPATYEFEQGADPAAVIREFLDAFENNWKEEYSEKANSLGLSVDEVVRIASIVEKEGADKDQFAVISSILHNRLNRSGLYPTLDCDSTKDYVTNTISSRVNSPSKLNAYILGYSTYERAGLPVGAICNPGSDAIEAALNPETTQYYYFAHDKNKKLYTASTLDEHTANKRTIEKINEQDD